MSNKVHRSLFGLACLMPAALIIAAALVGGPWLWAAFASITICVVVMDRIGPQFDAPASMRAFLPAAVTLAHFGALAATLLAVGHIGAMDTGEKVLLIVTMGLFAGQVSNACAHELIHRTDKTSRKLGTMIYCSILNGHHVSAHLLVHHVHAATEEDPNSAPLGQGFYRYFLKASVAEYRAGFLAENRRSRRKQFWMHPYAHYSLGTLISLVAAYWVGGSWAVVALLVISLHAQAQLLLSDYVQHYGLQRQVDKNSKSVPMGPQHSWNAPQSYSSALMMNAPRHSDHHMYPARDFTQLRLSDDMPVLPRSVPVMAAVALIPPLWRHMMDHRVKEWMRPQQNTATAAKGSAATNARQTIPQGS